MGPQVIGGFLGRHESVSSLNLLCNQRMIGLAGDDGVVPGVRMANWPSSPNKKLLMNSR